MAFTLSVYPWVYTAKYANGAWTESFEEKNHLSPDEEARLPHEELESLLQQRNSFPNLPLINYTTQYGLGCFEGLKAFPQADGSLKLFRPIQNAARFRRSMEGLKMPGFPEEMFVEAARTVVSRNQTLGFAPTYDPSWEADNFVGGDAVYLRPFSYSEPAVGLGLSSEPWVVIATTRVGSYFRPGSRSAVTTSRVRAVPGGTGWIKCNANYVTAILAKKEAESDGYMEAIFLDAKEHRYVEEGSSCNIFFSLRNGELVTPDLGDTILPGITRDSVLTIAQDLGIPTSERRLSIDEAMTETSEAFVVGTAAGIAHIESITHLGKRVEFNSGQIGEVTKRLQYQLSGIKYGSQPSRKEWMTAVS